MERLLLEELKKWQEKPNRKPLVLQGARQVGKTWLLKEFGKRFFDDVCYVNFERTSPISDVFDGDLTPQRLITQLSLLSGKKIEPQKTLIIFDEVQEIPRALTSLKYFAEEAPEYAVCCAGSLLGIALHSGTSFPVGKVDFLTLYPLSFQEFLMAEGELPAVEHVMQGDLDTIAVNDRLMRHLKNYFVIGGMPAAVQQWIESEDYFAVEKIQEQLLNAYVSDFSKHAPSNIVAKIRYVWQSIPNQLAKENKKFVFGLVREGARAREYEDALMWLFDTGIIKRVYKVTKPDIPLKAYEDLHTFKIYLHDVGLLRLHSGVDAKVILEGSRIFEEFKGALTEQFVLQELSVYPELYANHYWTSGATAEIDFIIQHNLQIYPVEAKAGLNVKAKSLKVFMNMYQSHHAIRTSLRPFRIDGNIINIPLYQLFAIKCILNKVESIS